MNLAAGTDRGFTAWLFPYKYIACISEGYIYYEPAKMTEFGRVFIINLKTEISNSGHCLGFGLYC